MLPTMASSHPITTAKAAFLSRQVRLLCNPLTAPPPTEPSLPDKTLADVVDKANKKIKSHNASVFSAQAQRHIAEQIETLYWNEVLAEREQQAQVGETGVKRDLDLSSLEDVQELAERWADVDGENEEDETAAEKYTEMRTQLLDLCRRRDEAAEKLARYERLQKLLEPYENPQQRIQPNLVQKDGEMAKELERMRVLLARVTARMGERKESPRQTAAGAASHEGGLTFDERLATLIDTP